MSITFFDKLFSQTKYRPVFYKTGLHKNGQRSYSNNKLTDAVNGG